MNWRLTFIVPEGSEVLTQKAGYVGFQILWTISTVVILCMYFLFGYLVHQQLFLRYKSYHEPLWIVGGHFKGRHTAQNHMDVSLNALWCRSCIMVQMIVRVPLSIPRFGSSNLGQLPHGVSSMAPTKPCLKNSPQRFSGKVSVASTRAANLETSRRGLFHRLWLGALVTQRLIVISALRAYRWTRSLGVAHRRVERQSVGRADFRTCFPDGPDTHSQHKGVSVTQALSFVRPCLSTKDPNEAVQPAPSKYLTLRTTKTGP